MATLVFKSGPLAGRSFPIRSEVRIGRQDSDIVVDDAAISRQHAAVRPTEDGLEIRDLGSVNGTWVNGARLDRPAKLGPGDSVMLGQISIDVVFETDDRSPSVPQAMEGERTQVRPQPRAPKPAEQPRAAASPVPPPSRPFGAHVTSSRRRPGKIATRRRAATLLPLLVIMATAAALIAYFALR